MVPPRPYLVELLFPECGSGAPTPRSLQLSVRIWVGWVSGTTIWKTHIPGIYSSRIKKDCGEKRRWGGGNGEPGGQCGTCFWVYSTECCTDHLQGAQSCQVSCPQALMYNRSRQTTGPTRLQTPHCGRRVDRAVSLQEAKLGAKPQRHFYQHQKETTANETALPTGSGPWHSTRLIAVELQVPFCVWVSTQHPDCHPGPNTWWTPTSHWALC